ncbi:MAG: hypothetical protein WKF94_17410 [Solirubrobacteraceae bacterium]
MAKRTAEAGKTLVKRCATAVGEGAMVVRFVHERPERRPHLR